MPLSPPVLLRHKSLDETPASFSDGPLQQQLSEAHAAAVAAARERLQHSISISVDPTVDDPTPRDLAEDDETISDSEAATKEVVPRLGRLVGYRPVDHRLIDIVRQAVQGAWGPGSPAAALVATEYLVTLDAGDGQKPIDPRSVAPLMKQLSDGWQLRVTKPLGLDADVQMMIDDLAVTFGATEPTLVYGIRSALGAQSSATAGARVLVQLAGVRSVLLQDDGDQNQLRLEAGSVLYVPPGQVVSHLPLDVDTLHLEVSLTPEGSDLSTEQRAMTRVRVGGSYSAAQAVVAADPQVGWPMRLVAPGGVHVVAVEDEQSIVIVGASELVLNETGIHLLVELTKGNFSTGAELAEAVGCEPGDAVAFCEALWELGLLDPAVPVEASSTHTGERLTQVASTTLEAIEPRNQLLSCVDASNWRPPETGTVHHGPSVEVAVQPVIGDEALAVVGQLSEIAASMNQQFFGVDINRLDPDDPPMLVRVRPAQSSAGDPELGVGSDLAAAHTNRKITFLFSITEADGGWVQFPAGSDSAVPEAGGISVWASFRPWTLTPMDHGERLFLIGRLHGPAFS